MHAAGLVPAAVLSRSRNQTEDTGRSTNYSNGVLVNTSCSTAATLVRWCMQTRSRFQPKEA